MQVEKIFINGQGFYEIDGKRVPSISTILSYDPEKEEKLNRFYRQPKIDKWGLEKATQLMAEEMEYASWRGTSTHTLIEKYLLDGREPVEANDTPEVLFFIMKSELDNINIKVPQFRIEEVVYSEKLGVAGRLDCVASYRGQLSVIDFKTARKPKTASDRKTWFEQLTFYALANAATNGDVIEELVVINATECGKLRTYHSTIWEHLDSLNAKIERYREAHEIF